jgi:glycosyltransferase involved in cell wall biosynthesis
MYSLIIPVYKNEGSIPELLDVVEGLNMSLGGELEVVFVVDGSPDRSYSLLHEALQHRNFRGILIEHSRNFGSSASVRTGLSEASGPYFAVMSADLQEPPTLILEFFKILTSEPIDVAIGIRRKRNDPFFSKLASMIFWALYRKLVQKEMPPGGADVFACNIEFRNQLLKLGESYSSPVGLLFWLGFRRKLVAYDRLKRRHGLSAWSFSRKVRYLMDSVFAFTDLPIRMLVILGIIGLIFFCCLGTLVFIAKITGRIQVPGYTATILTISFFAALNSLGLGLIGSYVWRTFENTKGRPHSIVMSKIEMRNKDANEPPR